MSDEELADAVGDVEEFVYGLWLELGEVRREARRGGRIGQGRLYDMALSTRWFVAARLWSLADGMEGGKRRWLPMRPAPRCATSRRICAPPAST